MVGANLGNNEALSYGSLHKKVESEKQFQLIHTNKEDYQLCFLEITVGLTYLKYYSGVFVFAADYVIKKHTIFELTPMKCPCLLKTYPSV